MRFPTIRTTSTMHHNKPSHRDPYINLCRSKLFPCLTWTSMISPQCSRPLQQRRMLARTRLVLLLPFTLLLPMIHLVSPHPESEMCKPCSQMNHDFFMAQTLIVITKTTTAQDHASAVVWVQMNTSRHLRLECGAISVTSRIFSTI